MKLIHRFPRFSLNTSGTVCDRCQAVELDPPEPSDVLDVPSEETSARKPAFVTVGIDHGPEGDYFSGHFCPSCNEILQSEPGGWMPYLRQIAAIRQGPRFPGSHRAGEARGTSVPRCRGRPRPECPRCSLQQSAAPPLPR